MYKAPKAKTVHQHFALSSLGSANRTEWFLPLLRESEQMKLLAKSTVMLTFLLKLWQLTFYPSDFIWWFRIKKKKWFPPAKVSALLCLSIPLGYGLGYVRYFLWSAYSGLAVSRCTAGTKFRAGGKVNTVVWGVTNGRFAQGLITSERH